MTRSPGAYFVFDPAAVVPLPCLQTGRRAGVAVITAGLDDRPLPGGRYLTARSLTQPHATASAS